MLGIVSALAFPPFYATPLLWLVYPCLLFLLDGAKTHRQAFAIAWWFGFGQFATAFYWLTNSMLTDIAHWWWAIPFASTILPILLAFIPGFAVMMWWRAHQAGVLRIVGFAAWLMIGEWIRGHFLTGFPWNLTGQGWIAWLPVLQSYAWLGQYGLGFLTVAAASLPILLADRSRTASGALALTVGGVAIFCGLAAWGEYRLSATADPGTTGLVFRLVQPNVAQGDKWTKDLAEQHFETLLRLSRQPGEEGLAPRFFIWPETAIPFPLDWSPEIPRAIASVLKPGGLVLAGTLRVERHGAGRSDYYNSLEVVDSNGDRLARYDKTHLAPFGEYMPFRNVLPLDALAVGSQDLTPGRGAETITVPGIPPFAAAICYEAIFAETLVDLHNRPKFLVQVTNDGWFGVSAGPHQHFAMAQSRAVEQGMPLLRAANTGVSGAVDSFGRVLGSLPLGSQGVLDVTLPGSLPRPPFYARHGDLIFAIMLGLYAIWSGLWWRSSLHLRDGGDVRHFT